MSLSQRKQASQLVPFIKQIESIKASNGKSQLSGNMDKQEQKDFLRTVIIRIIERVSRI